MNQCRLISHALIDTFVFDYVRDRTIMKNIRIIIVPTLVLAFSGSAIAAPDQAFCKMVGSLARGITEDRERGVSYNAELGKIIGATQDLPSSDGILAISKSALNTAYLEMPKITPEGAYKLHYVACMAVK